MLSITTTTAVPRQPSSCFRPSEDTLARAVLTFCLDGADALMYATIKGAQGAVEALQLIIE